MTQRLATRTTTAGRLHPSTQTGQLLSRAFPSG